ncbi:MAG: hypothetical protein ACFB6R_06100 [Alphaproteobacteria bacterium]
MGTTTTRRGWAVWLKRGLWYLFLSWLVATVVFFALYWRMIHMVVTYNTILIPPFYAEPADTAQARAQDLDYLRKLITIDRSFSESARAEFTALLDGAAPKLADMSDAAFYLLIAKAAALADNGHTGISDQPLYRRFKTIRARLHWFADGLFVVRAEARHALAVGQRVLAVDGRPIAKVVAGLSAYRGGNAPWRRALTPLMIEAPAILHAAGLAESPEGITFTLEAADGAVTTMRFEAVAPEDPGALPRRRAWRRVTPAVLPEESDALWVRAFTREGDDAPLYLRDLDAPFFAPLPGGGHYIRTQTGFGSPTQSVPAFFEAALSGIPDGSLDYLVVDYRWNSGGDYTKAIAFAKAAPEKVKPGGTLYLAVGPQTFSAAIVAVAMLKYYGGEKSVIIGTPMGDRGQFWAERGMSFVLPNSGYAINYATGYHDWEKGCTGEPYCFTLNQIHEVPAGSLAPQIRLAPTFADYTAGRDVVMDWVLDDQGIERSAPPK